VRISSDAKGYLAQLEVREKERTGIAALKVSYNRVFGYYIEVPKSRAGPCRRTTSASRPW